ncbi:MAG: sodium-dependent transporter [Lentisphaeria bacterium]|nr:sodium-dependent transporter [Lentisphaeria bacterium]
MKLGQRPESFSGKLGFVLAAAGSAVGLGNIWRFPYLTAKYGGGIFLVTYLLLVLSFGYALLISEIGIGRMTRRSPIGAFRKLCRKKRSFLGSIRIGGWINAIVPMLIVPYYFVIGGWVTKYMVALAVNPVDSFHKDRMVEVGGKAVTASAAYFQGFVTSWQESLIYFLLFLVITAAVVGAGVKKGIERFNKVLMPMLVVLIVGICIYCMFLPNSGAGFRYYLMPDFSRFSYMTVIAAMGQLFFSLSIAMGIMVTYGVYMRREDDLVSNVNQVELFDTGISFLAGMMIIPAVVSFGGEQAAENAGPGLIFVIMPQVFASFPAGRFFGTVFFILVLFAASTSAVSLLETNVHTLSQELRLSRGRALACALFEIMVIGVITVLGYSVLSHVHPLAFIEKYRNYDILDSLDFISNSVMMPIGAIFTTVLVVAVIGLDKFSQQIRGEKKWYREYLFQLCMCVVVIPCLLIVLLNAVGILN